MNGFLGNMDVLMNLGGVPSAEPRGMSRLYVVVINTNFLKKEFDF